MKKRKTVSSRRGQRTRRTTLTAKERRFIAYHECGHAVVQKIVDPSIRIVSVRIRVERGQQLGGTQLAQNARQSVTMFEMHNQICMLYGGRAAEALMLHDLSDLAQTDLARVYDMARWMVMYLGMSNAMPPLSLPSKKTQLSERMRRAIDKAVNEILEDQYSRALLILTLNYDLLQRMATVLEEKGMLRGRTLTAFLSEVKGPSNNDPTPISAA